MRLSTFYDLGRLSQAIDLPILEWQDIKQNDFSETESLVCWRTYARDVSPTALRPFNIDVAFWPIPDSTYDEELPTLSSLEALALKPLNTSNNGGVTFDSLRATLGDRNRAVPSSLPDQHLLCFDQFFWILDGTFVNGRLHNNESIEEPSPRGRSWREVGRHLHYTAAFDRVRDEFLAAILGRTTQNYIAVHLRQGDFVWYSRVGDKAEAPFVSAVEEVQRELAGRHWAAGAPAWAGAWRKPLPVVFATDSTDPDYIAALKARGWYHLDHTKFKTVERFGGWQPSMLDLAVMSHASGFVG